jgi:hypothetical protein
MAPRATNPAPSIARLAGSGTAAGAADTVPEMLAVKPRRVEPMTATGAVTSANQKLNARGSPKMLLGRTLEVNDTVPGGSEADRVRDEPPTAPNTKSVKLAVR